MIVSEPAGAGEGSRTFHIDDVLKLHGSHMTTYIWRESAVRNPKSNASTVCPQTLKGGGRLSFAYQEPAQFLETLLAASDGSGRCVQVSATGFEKFELHEAHEAATAGAEMLQRHFDIEQSPAVKYDSETMYESTFVDRLLRPLWQV